MSYQEWKPLYTWRKSKNYKGNSDRNWKSLRRKKDAAQGVHRLLTYAEWRNSRRQTLKNMRTRNNNGWGSTKRNRIKNNVHTSVKRSRQKMKCQGRWEEKQVLARCMHTDTETKDVTHIRRIHKAPQNRMLYQKLNKQGITSDSWLERHYPVHMVTDARDSPLLRVYPEKLGFLTWQDLKLWGIDLRLTEKTPLVIFYIWSNNATRFPLNYTRPPSPGWWKDGNAQRNGNLGDHQNSFLPEKKWEGVTG